MNPLGVHTYEGYGSRFSRSVYPIYAAASLPSFELVSSTLPRRLATINPLTTPPFDSISILDVVM
jgi:hypothetical protein